jgi:hypothetical protein
MISRFLARSSFLLSYPRPERSALRLMSPEFRRFVGRKCTNGCLALHVLRAEFGELVSRWKQDFPDLPILRYANIQRINDDPHRLDGSFFNEAWSNRYDWCVLRFPRADETEPQPRYGDGRLWMDITNTTYRSKVVEHLAKEVREAGCDGLLIDSHHWELAGRDNIVGGAELNSIWQAGARAVLEELKAALGANSIVMFNGLWGFNGEEQAIKQGEMLNSADGISVEFYGVDGHEGHAPDPSTEWQLFVGNLNAQLEAVGRDKYALINGQRLSGLYASYADDYAAGLYCYANFLLGPLDPKHGFHYGHFQCSKLIGERSGGYDYFDFQDLRLGLPLNEEVKATKGSKTRVFEGGIVLVAPTAKGDQTFNLERAYYTMAGEEVHPGQRNLREGAAEILVTVSPTPPPETLGICRLRQSMPWKLTECMAQATKSGWYRYRILNLRVRSTEIDSAILVRVEIDDDPSDNYPHTHGIVVIRPQSGTFVKSTQDYPYGEAPNGRAINEWAHETYTADGNWRDLSVKLDSAMGRPCYRVAGIRAEGAVECALLTLSGRTGM